MASIVICGGSSVGLGTAAMLALDGHEVTVLESDPAPPPAVPADAWTDWARKGVAQFRQPHTQFSRFRHVCDEELPGSTDRLAAAGAAWVDALANPPPGITDRAPRDGDERLVQLVARRPVVEAVLAGVAADTPGVTVRRGVRVAGLLSGPSVVPGAPHVVGVRLADGAELRADWVIDAMGRNSPGVDWLVELGARPPLLESSDCGFAYYTRYFTGPDKPQPRGPNLAPIGTISLITLASDNDTWSVTVFCPTGDAPLKELRRGEVFARVVGACPFQAHWLDGTPITDVLPMSGVTDRYRRFRVDGVPVATGIAVVGDAWACSNPSAGRGMSLGFLHAQHLRRTLREHVADPAAFAEAWDEVTERVVAPYFRHQMETDRIRRAEMDALRRGEVPPPAQGSEARLRVAAARNPDALRGLLEIVQCLALPEEVLARPAVRAAVAEVDGLPPPFPGPDRGQLLTLLSA